MKTHVSAVWPAALGLLLLAGCNGGLVALGSSSSGGSSDAAPVVASLQVPFSVSSPASIYFVVFDQNGDLTNVDVNFRPDASSAFQPITLHSTSKPLTAIPSSADVPYEVLWDFASDLGGGGYFSGVEIQLVVAGGSAPPILSDLEIGNDAPQVVIAEVQPEGASEYGGNVQVNFTVADSAGDALRIKVEYNDDTQNGFPEAAWKLARPAGLAGDTPEFAYEDLPTTAGGVEVTFVWESHSVTDPNFTQLDGKEADVLLRFSPSDEFQGGDSAQTTQFHIDNNEAPFAILDQGSFLLNPDERRGISVPFIVLDDESDPIRVVLQWRREGEEFPPLPATALELLELIDDPARDGDRKLVQIGRQFPKDFTGRVEYMSDPLLSADQVRLPELGGSGASELLALGIAGETLEILRPGTPEVASWAENPAVAAVAAVAMEDGLAALVLEADRGGWRVRSVDLTNGEAQPFASGPGVPRVMSADPLRKHVFVASDAQVFRLAYADGAAEGSIVHSFVDGPRGLAALGENRVLATGDDTLMSIDFDPEGEPLTQLLDGLAQPWGVVVDPLRPHGLYLAEAGADRVLTLDLDSLKSVTLTAEVSPALGVHLFPRPRALALENKGQRLLVMTEQAGTNSLRGLNLRRPNPLVFEITNQLGQPDAGLATGPEQLRIVCLSNALALGGGVQQVRSIVDEPAETGDLQPYDPRTQVVELKSGFDPALSGIVNWRIRKRLKVASSSPLGDRSRFLWDSREVLGGGKIQVRVLPLDADVGVVGPMTGLKQVRWGLDVPPLVLDDRDTNGAFSVATGDLDGDGDIDLVSANLDSETLTIFYQTSAGQFVLHPDGALPSPGGVRSVAIGDLNGDGAPDLVVASVVTNSLTIFFQTSPGQFELDAQHSVLAAAGPFEVAIGDLNGDGALDLVSANFSGSSLSVYFQDQAEPGQFLLADTLTDPNLAIPMSVAIGDLDGDGKLDVVSTNRDLNSLVIFFQTSAGSFVTNQNSVLNDPDGRIVVPRSVAVGDLDGDGDLDLVSANRDSNNLTIFFQTSPGQFTIDESGPLVDPVIDVPIFVALFDLDTDGDLDVVTANNGGSAEFGNIAVFFQTSAGQFTANPSGPLTDPNVDSPQTLAIGDLDGDGAPDIVSANYDSGNLSIFLQATPGQFTVDVNGGLGDPIMETTWDPVTGDFDGDGDLDLATANRDSDNLTIFFQTSPGRYTLSSDGPLIDNDMVRPNALVTGDLDGDGDLDLVSSNAISSNLTIFFQTSPGKFTIDENGPLDDFVVTPRDVGIGDLNGDGLLDLVSANRASNSLTIFFQSDASPGQFTVDPRGPLIGPAGAILAPQSVSVGDLDGDGDMDLVTANDNSHNLTIFFQVSPGQFEFDPGGPLGGSPVMRNPFSVAIGDLDGDGDMDLVSTNWVSNNITIFFQTTPGSFTADPGGPLTHADILEFDAPQDVSIADLDRDGDMDLVSANFESETLTIFFQVNPGQFAIDPRGPLSDSGSTTSPGTLTVGDMDGDGDPDVVSANEFSNTLTIFFGAH